MFKISRQFPPQFFLLTCTILLYSCNKTISCNGYSNSILDEWFPYHNNQQLLFRNSTNHYDTINLQLIDSTLPYNYTSGFNRSDVGCDAEKSFVSSQIDTNNNPRLSIQLLSHFDGTKNVQSQGAEFTFSDISSFQGQNLTESGFTSFDIIAPVSDRINLINGTVPANGIPQTFYNFSLNGIVYSLAQSITNDSAVVHNNIPCVYKVIYAKDAGIIEYETNPGSIVWIKQ